MPLLRLLLGVLGDLVRGLVCSLEDALGLLGDLLERVPDRGLGGGGDLELGDDLVDATHEGVDLVAVIAAQRGRKAHVAQLGNLAVGHAGPPRGAPGRVRGWLVGLDASHATACAARPHPRDLPPALSSRGRQSPTSTPPGP